MSDKRKGAYKQTNWDQVESKFLTPVEKSTRKQLVDEDIAYLNGVKDQLTIKQRNVMWTEFSKMEKSYMMGEIDGKDYARLKEGLKVKIHEFLEINRINESKKQETPVDVNENVNQPMPIETVLNL